MTRLVVMLAPSRHDLIVALEFPLLAAPIVLLTLRYRMFNWQITGQRDLAPAAWRLSAYITILFVMAAYPLSLANYRGWFWDQHRVLTLCALLFWFSLCAWAVIRHFSIQKQADVQLQRELESISSGVEPAPVADNVRWVRTWGWLNLVAFALLSVGVLRLLLLLC